MADTPSSKQNRFKWQRFLTPAWLAGVLSVGFHGVLFAAGPTFPNLGFNQLTEAEAAAERRNVPLVELTAAEQERLPDFSGSFYNFDAFSDLEPLSPPFGDNPGSSSGSRDRPLNSQPLLSPNNRSVPPSASRLPFDITRLESGSRSPFPLPSNALPPVRQDRGATKPNPAAADAPTAPAANPAEQPPGADALRPDRGDLEVSAQEEADIAANSNPTDTLSLEERLQAYTFDSNNTETDAIAARFGEWLETGQALATDLEIGDPEAIQATFEEAAATGILSAQPDNPETEADDETPESGLVQRPIELALDYGAGICLTKAPQKGLIGAWVGPEGNLLGEPEVIRSTGYLGLNQQAIRYIETLDFSTVEAFTGYQFEVLVNYDPEDCVEVGRRTPAAPADDVSPEADRSDIGRKTPAKAPDERPRATDRDTSSPTRPPEADTEEADPEAESAVPAAPNPAPPASDSDATESAASDD